MTLEAALSEESLDNSVEKTWYATLNLQIVWLSYWKTERSSMLYNCNLKGTEIL